MKFIFSFFIAFGMMLSFMPDAKAAPVQVTVTKKVCTVQKRYQSGHYNHHGYWVSGHYKNVTVCRNVPRTVIRYAPPHRASHRHHGHHGHHRHHGHRNVHAKVSIKL